MIGCLLADYKLSCFEVLQSIVVSEYGLRHLEQANLQPEQKWEHRLVALVEFIPVIGQLATLIEWVVFRVLSQNGTFPDSLPQRKWLFTGSQGGPLGAPQNQIMPIVNRLNTQKEYGIDFDPKKVTGIVEGGYCSAMSLDFATSFFRLRKVQDQTGPYSSETFLNSIRDLREITDAKRYQICVQQAAFNTLAVRADGRGIDLTRNKIQSLANLHNFRINYASREISVNESTDNALLNEEVSQLPDGVYLLRTIKPANNEKQEEHGHTMFYVKSQHEGFFYDPNSGAKYMKNISHLPDLSQTLTKCYQSFQTSKARFYRLAPTVA